MPTFIIYKTTNIINGKFYIGKHKVSEKYDHLYLGSGHQIVAAIKKYGKENFIRETLYEFIDENECIKKEAEIVNNELISNPYCYNIATGGDAGKSHSTNTKKMISDAVKEEWKNNEIRREKTRILATKRVEDGNWGPKSLTDESRKKISESAKKYWGDENHKEKRRNAISESLTGRKLSEEHVNAFRIAQNKTRLCIHCNQEHKLASYGRWHGDKCKHKTKEIH
jgi:group I intron endonuclease